MAWSFGCSPAAVPFVFDLHIIPIHSHSHSCLCSSLPAMFSLEAHRLLSVHPSSHKCVCIQCFTEKPYTPVLRFSLLKYVAMSEDVPELNEFHDRRTLLPKYSQKNVFLNSWKAFWDSFCPSLIINWIFTSAVSVDVCAVKRYGRCTMARLNGRHVGVMLLIWDEAIKLTIFLHSIIKPSQDVTASPVLSFNITHIPLSQIHKQNTREHCSRVYDRRLNKFRFSWRMMQLSC